MNSNASKREVPSLPYPLRWDVLCILLKICDNDTSKLLLSRSCIDDTSLAELSSAFASNNVVTQIDLSGNAFTHVGITAFTKSLLPNTALLSMKLDNNAVGQDGAIALAQALRNNETMTQLSLRSCEIDDEGIRSISSCFIKRQRQHLDSHQELPTNNNICSGDEGVDSGATAADSDNTHHQHHDIVSNDDNINNINKDTNSHFTTGSDIAYSTVSSDTSSDDSEQDQTSTQQHQQQQQQPLQEVADDVMEDAIKRWSSLQLRREVKRGRLDPACCDRRLRTLLMWAAIHNNKESLEMLLQMDTYYIIECHDMNGQTALHHAARSGNSACVDALITAGANPLAENSKGQTPLQLAQASGKKLRRLQIADKQIRQQITEGAAQTEAAQQEKQQRRQARQQRREARVKAEADRIEAEIEAEAQAKRDKQAAQEAEWQRLQQVRRSAAAEVKPIVSGIRELDITDNKIGPDGATALAMALAANEHLTELTLTGNSIGPEGGAAVADALRTNSCITKLSLCRCSLGAHGATALATDLSHDPHLKRINISSNGIGDNGAVQLAHGLHNNNNLIALDLRWNNISRTGAIALKELLQSNATVTSLNIDRNNIHYQLKSQVEHIACMNGSHRTTTCKWLGDMYPN